MAKEINIGDYVQNKSSGKFGYVAELSPDNKKLTVLTLKRTYASWSAKNVKLIKDAKR